MNTNIQPTGDTEANARANRIGAWMEIITLALLATFFAYSYATDRVRLFLAPIYIWLTPMAAVSLYAMAIARLRAHRQGYVSGELEEASAWQVPLWVCVSILLLPVVLAVVVNPQGPSVELARKHRISRPARDVQLAQAVDWILGLKKAAAEDSPVAISLPDNPTILDLLDALAEGHQRGLEGQFVTVIGQCDLLDGPKSKRFDVYRMVVTCCIADATTVLVEVARRPALDLKPQQWVRVEGIIKFDSQSYPSLPVIHATAVSKVPEPREPYL